LTEAVRRQPYSVVLLDEIEKAHPEVFNVLLQLLDEGRLTDNQGRTVDFKNCIIIMTSNLGSHLIQESLDNFDDSRIEHIMGELRVKLSEMLKKTIRPEFLNRIDEIVMFRPLLRKDLIKIVDIQISKLSVLLSQKNMSLELSEEVKDKLLSAGYDVSYGARPLKRVIQKYLINHLSTELIMNKYEAGDIIFADVDNKGKIIFRKKE